MATEIPYAPLPLDLSDVTHMHGPDSTLCNGVPAGTVTEISWASSTVYPGTSRRFWVHVPAAYDPAEPAALMVFQDGDYLLDPEGEVRAGVVLDNLVHRGDLPVTIGVFVDPGVLAGPENADPRSLWNRNEEYDAFDDRYARLLLDEVLPEVTRRWAVTDDPARRGLCGFSSGGNCSFTAAWLRPDAFGLALCSLSSFAQMPGGNPYPELLPRTPHAPMRVLLHLAQRDLGWDEPEDNWLAENLRVAAALVESEHDVRVVLGDGGHSPQHLGVLLPDALRWLFREPR